MKNFWYVSFIMVTTMLITGCSTPGDIQPTYTPSAAVTLRPSPTSLPTRTDMPTAEATTPPSQSPRPLPTNTRRIVSIATQTRLPMQTPSKTATPCPDAPLSQLKLKDWAMVSLQPWLPNNVRAEPGLSAKVIGVVQPGAILQIIDGPRCADGYSWWQSLSSAGLQGWTAEGDASGYWIVPLQPVVDWGTDQNTVTLTAGQVTSAGEIEGAINNATKYGTRPGVVILDGSQGPFVYTQPDRSLNIFVSNLALLGVNQAQIKGCGDGLFFDNFPLRNIQVAGIEFFCEGHGIHTSSAFDAVIFRDNIFHTGRAAIIMSGASSNWTFIGNHIDTQAVGIDITSGKNFFITGNHINGNTAILLRQCYDFQVRNNILIGGEWGMQIIQKAARNLVQNNTILQVSLAGIHLGTDTVDNQILSNRITCAVGASCIAVDASPAAAEANTIKDNTP